MFKTFATGSYAHYNRVKDPFSPVSFLNKAPSRPDLSACGPFGGRVYFEHGRQFVCPNHIKRRGLTNVLKTLECACPGCDEDGTNRDFLYCSNPPTSPAWTLLDSFLYRVYGDVPIGDQILVPSVTSDVGAETWKKKRIVSHILEPIWVLLLFYEGLKIECRAR